MSDSKKINELVDSNRVKLHIFEPSQRKIWTVVGKSKEHWLDPAEEFCSCPGYYFGKLNGKNTCYHIDSILLAQKKSKYETIKFSDEEYANFMSGIIRDL